MLDTKLSKSRLKGQKRSKWFVQKYFRLLQQDKDKAQEFFKKQISVLNSRCTKSFLLEISYEMQYYFMRLLGDSASFDYSPEKWLKENLEWYLS